MQTRKTLALVTLILGSSALWGVELVPVPGSANRYPTVIDGVHAGKPIKLLLTGATLRKKVVFSVYTIGSYVQDGVTVRSADELVAADCVKQLHLVMERDAAGKDLGSSFIAAIRVNHPEPAFADEAAKLMQLLDPIAVKKGDHIWLTHVPQIGLHCTIVGKANFLVKNKDFAHAVWEIYFGRNCLSETMKKDLLARL